MNEHRLLPEAREICPTTTRRLIGEGALLVDVREPSEIATLAFDVPELITIPLGELPGHLAELPRERQLVMVCKGDGRSLKATYFLMYQGYERVASMAGGIDKWASKAFPVKGDASSLESTVRSSSGCCEATPGEAPPFRAPTNAVEAHAVEADVAPFNPKSRPRTEYVRPQNKDITR